MSLQSVRDHLASVAPDLVVIETDASSATVELAAAAHKVAPGQIAKTLTFKVKDTVFLLVARGDARLDNKKAKAAFGGKAKMVSQEEAEALTGHPVGGVCPFGLAQPLPVYCDVSLRDFDDVLPAAGATNAAVRIAPDRLADITGADWVDVCQPPRG
ncbi:YbaK/EbsC family protein [Roseibium denhamense]|uniref:Cys-tRNA(Pro) deacylase, prolyl-tRNA editing enzyme YbaK/EbsC n=1 Tax=Roseibium denhamense TaxID=76305 RepID=A0ABY1PMZ9_9HYPH|nr:YbaK/EbsC family protein [Roseibium denhamense]MTI04112.1 YbaK/EbsC family protein [Roseibium denhamense]SMP37355.1 Cys-tRNA(Pro) deacylase, prolyl-tRNA editing enzyme YbaK/EbsC [Roseibium denhamense]